MVSESDTVKDVSVWIAKCMCDMANVRAVGCDDRHPGCDHAPGDTVSVVVAARGLIAIIRHVYRLARGVSTSAR
ncbi:MAG TPA: hypothetical protein VEZ44_02400, partial [bacterium]|nr:hypothetical protein [bacterium]